MVRVHTIGTGDAFGNGGRFQTCVAIRDAGAAVLVDCGATSLTAMKSAGMDPLEVDLVVVSHLHGDHFAGLPFLILDAQFRRRARPLHVLGPPTIASRLTAVMEDVYPGSTGVQRRFEVRVHELVPDGTPETVDGITFRGWEVDHPCGAPPLALRIELDGAVMAYTGDTAWTPALLPACAGADLLLAEAYTWGRQVKYHLRHEDVRAHLDAFAAERLLLTHMSPEVLERLDQTCAEPARDGASYAL